MKESTRAVPRPISAHVLETGGFDFAIFELEILPPLTLAEREVTRLILRGHDNARIAAARHVTVGTTASHVSSIYRKLRVRSRRELVALLTGK